MSKQNGQSLTGNEILKRILPIIISFVLIIGVALTVVLISNSNDKKPTFDSANEIYFEIGDMKVTNEKLYIAMKQDYGVAELIRLIDNKIYASQVAAVNDEDLVKFIIKSLYSVDDIADYDGDPQEEWDKLIDSLKMNNLIKASEVDDTSFENQNSHVWSVVKDYYRLQFARSEWAKAAYVDKYKEENSDELFTEKTIKDYYNEHYTGQTTAIVIPFTSKAAATAMMAKYGINTQSNSSINKEGWVKDSYDYNSNYTIEDSDRFTYKEVKDIFFAMYNEVLSYYNNGSNIITNDKIDTSVDYDKTIGSASAALEEAIDGLGEIKGTVNLPREIAVNGIGNIALTYTLEENDILNIANGVISLKENASGSEKLDLSVTFTLTIGENTYTQTLDLTIEAEVASEAAEAQTVSVEAVDVIEKYTLTSEFVENSGNEFAQFSWTSEELSAIDSKVNSNLKYGGSLKLSTNPKEFYKSYTVAPVEGTNYTFLMLKLDETAPAELDGNDELKNEIIEKLLDELKTDNNVNKMIYENRNDHKLQIYDKYLEAVYEYNYNYFFGTTLGLSDYTEFDISKKRQKSVVASIEIDGKKFEITAEELFNSLEEKYGAGAIIDLANEYNVLGNTNYNKIFNPYTGEVYNKDALDQLLKGEVSGFRNNFELDYFTYSYLSYYGFIPNFPSSYGWNDFRTDYFGAFTDKELVVSNAFGGQAYSDAYDAFKKSIYTNLDELVANEMQKTIDEQYSLSVINLIVSIDTNYDGTYDTNDVNGDDDNWTAEQNALAKELAKLMYAKANETAATSLSDQLSALVTLYNEAELTNDLADNSYEALLSTSIYESNIWAKYKKAGLVVKFETANTYTNTSSLVEEFLDQLQILWDQIKDMGLLGTTLDAPLVSAEPFESSYGYHHIAVLSTTEASELPTAEQIEIYKALLELNEVKDLTYKYKQDEIQAAQDAYNAVLAKYGYDEDFEFDKDTTTRLEETYDAAVKAVESNGDLTKALINFIKTTEHSFKNANASEREEQLNIILEISENELNEEEGE